MIFMIFFGRRGLNHNIILILILAGVSWGLWKNMNSWVFSDLLMKYLRSLNHMILGFIQTWKKLARTKDMNKVEMLIQKLQGGLSIW